MLTSSHAGYAQSAGQALATPLARSLAATKPLRKPVNASTAGVVAPSVVDETDLGGGSFQVRLALSEHIYATDTGVSLSVAAGWRSSEAAVSGIAVSNGSTTAAPIPIMRWAETPYRRASAAFDLELVVFSHHPVALQPVAAVKFTVTDGTNTKTYWTTALASSPRHGDNLRCYRVSVDAAAAPALTAGLLRCDAEIYPWLGAMRSTDTAGTRSMTGLGTAAFATAAHAPFTIAWDPASSRYGDRWICVDPAGTVTASAVTVAASWTAAKAGTRAANVTTAIQAGYLNNRSLAIGNGQPAKARSVDGLQIGLIAGVHATVGTTAITTGITADESWTRVFGDPDDADPRANVVLRTAASTAGFRLGRMMLANMTLEVGTNTLSSGFPTYWAFDNIEVRGKAGQETNAVYPASATPPAGQAVLWITGSRYWRSGSAIQASSGFRPGLVRAAEFSRRADALALLSGRWLVDATVVGVQSVTAGWQQTLGDLGSQEDVIIAGCDLRSTTSRAWSPARLNAVLAGTTIDSIRRQVFANNVVERIGTDPQPFGSLGEDDLTSMTYNIIEGNSFIGERANLLYSDPAPATVAETDSQTNIALVNRVANNAFDWAATKHDGFDDPGSKTLRNAAGDPRNHGYRPQAVGCWASLYGVGFEGNADFGRHASAGNFAFEYLGRRSFQIVAGTPLYSLDASRFGTNTGGGNYKPSAGSALIGLGLKASVDRDRAGAQRVIPFAAGGIDTAAAALLTPGRAVSALRSAVPTVAWQASLTVANARSAGRATVAATTWSAGLAAGRADHAMRAASPVLGWRATVLPAAGLVSLTGIAPAIAASGALQLLPAWATSGWRDAGASLRRDLVSPTRRVLPAGADPRTLSIRLT